ncbi:MAG: XisI protein [Caldilineaceae bacterium]
MDSIKDYSLLVKQALDAYVELSNQQPVPTYQVVRVFDDISHHYLVRKLGWKGSQRISQIMIHVSLHDGKIWIEEDWTEDGIATYFLEKGVPNSDIVLAFQPPMMRPYTEFAVA